MKQKFRGDSLSPLYNQYYKQNLQNQDQRHSIYKIPVSGLMAEYPHTKNRTDASAGEGNEKECGLPNTPEVFDCFSFVNAHHGKADYVHQNQI